MAFALPGSFDSALQTRQEPQRHRKTDHIVEDPDAEDSCAINNSAVGAGRLGGDVCIFR